MGVDFHILDPRRGGETSLIWIRDVVFTAFECWDLIAKHTSILRHFDKRERCYNLFMTGAW